LSDSREQPSILIPTSGTAMSTNPSDALANHTPMMQQCGFLAGLGF
jgi:hypothetical protein